MLSIAACGVSTVQPTVSIDDKGCASSDTDEWPNGVLDIEVSNSSASTSAVVMGTYDDGLGREDLVAYGSDISTRPPFITALEILEVAPARTRTLVFDHDPGTYFMTCLPDQNTMIVLDDVIFED
jgi:hypothetical protein